MIQPTILVNASGEADTRIEPALAAAGYPVHQRAAANDGLAPIVQRLRPRLLVCDLAHCPPRALHAVLRVVRGQPCPSIVFTNDPDGGRIQEAVEAGVSAYIVSGLAPARIPAIIEVAQARFEELRTLHASLDQAKNQLSERKRVERAKGILMDRRRLSEEAAFHTLRRMAMDTGKCLGEVAESILMAERLLNQQHAGGKSDNGVPSR